MLTLSCTSLLATVYLKVSVFAERVSPTEWSTPTSSSGTYHPLDNARDFTGINVYLGSNELENDRTLLVPYPNYSSDQMLAAPPTDDN